ncbi:uncharacterized protein BDZ99DRAFT_572660 [Mytilinidion resinicola]|uniref:F-box domain-containing protein n=1 Tax=Mytilinidion resinicola TaxID=574789 RepID=A0A6A6YG91_9PEZI|nr:uncharacterized protein BDZ99DRAFT_572660 [Mytilinidion resinicola]KAF2807760.1 hypothetical protein BDZ99DRAFT_572660 [Mytilinidion resinicola]
MAAEPLPIKGLSFGQRKDRRRSINRSLLSITPENSNLQFASPLFSVLPAELRNQIFALACSQYRDTSRLVKGIHPRVCRPSHRHPVRTCTSLLRTCRLIYYETHVIPLQSATHYGDTVRAWPNYVFHLTRAQQLNLFHLHVSVYDYGDRDLKFFDKFTRGDGMYWKRITVLKNWYTRMPDLWVRPEGTRPSHALPIQVPLSCSEFVFELEVLPVWVKKNEYRGMEEAEEYVRRMETYKVLKIDGSSFARAPSRVERFSWTAPNKPELDTRAAVDMENVAPKCDVFRIVWKGDAHFN